MPMRQIKTYICALVCCICWLGVLTAAEAKAADAAVVQTKTVQGVPNKGKLSPNRGKEGLRRYDPAADRSPAEDVPVVETKFSFAEPLLVRPDTNGIVIHHVGVPSGDMSAEAIHKAHLAKGWAGIGYHYVIRKDGTIERGRPLAAVGAHAQGHNYDTIGINVTGNFDTERPTPEQIDSLERLLTFICRIYDIEAGVTTIEGHRDVNATDCPGDNLYRLLPQIRRDVKVRTAEKELEDADIWKILKKER